MVIRIKSIFKIMQIVSESMRPFLSKGHQCYLTTSRVSDIFPPVSLNFAGGASMILSPEDYLLQQISDSNVKKILEEGGTVEAANQLLRGGNEHDPSYLLGRLIRKKQPQDKSVAPPHQLSQITSWHV